MFQCLSRPAAENGRNSSRGLIRTRHGRGCWVDLRQPAARRKCLACLAGLFLVATPSPALTEPTGPPLLPLEAADDGLGGDYNKVGDFKIPTSAVAGGQDVAIRVTLKRMYIDSDEDPAGGCPVRAANTCGRFSNVSCSEDADCRPGGACEPDDCHNSAFCVQVLQSFEGQVRYLGPPAAFHNNDFSADQWVGAKLQCAPFYRDWSAAALQADLPDSFCSRNKNFSCSADADCRPGGACEPDNCNSSSVCVSVLVDTIYYYGAEVVPCSIHAVQQATQACVESANPEDCFSDPLEVRTSLWGDLWPPFGRASMTDIGKQVEAFKGIPFVVGGPSGAPNKWRSMLRGNEGVPDGPINKTDIGKAVDAFKAIAYPEKGPVDCP